MPSLEEMQQEFLAAAGFAVVGASNDPEKYGAKVFAAYRRRDLHVYPVNPGQREIQGVPAYSSLAALPEPVASVSVITPPPVTERIVEEAAVAGVTHLWLQPGAESPRAVQRGEELGLRVIHGGPCILVAFALQATGDGS